MTEYLVIWGDPLPTSRTFRYREAAEHLKQILTELGHCAEVVELNPTETETP